VEIYLVRHAEDRAAREGRFGDEGLTPAGKQQARALAEALRAVEFGACLSSPFKRALETAEILVEGREIPIRLDPDLAEGSPGDLAGLSVAEASRRYPEDFRVGRTVVARLAAAGRTAPGGETRAAFLNRAEAASRLVVQELERGNSSVLVVAHGGLLNYLLQILLRMPVRDEVPFGFENCGVLRILGYREPPGFGPFPMLRFGAP
jgi:broad specificity phosphatase PhoE